MPKVFSSKLDARRDMIINGQPLRVLLFLFWPTLLMSLVQSLTPVVDGLFVNRFSTIEVADAVGFSVPIIMFFNSISVGIAVASSALLGQINGSGNKEQLSFVTSQIMKIAILASLIVMPLPVVAAQIFKDVVDPAFSAPFVRYLSLYSFALPSFFISGIYNAIMNSTGKPERTFMLTSIFFVLKLGLNVLFLAILRLDEYGAVLASFIAGVITIILVFRDLYYKHRKELPLRLRKLPFDKSVFSTMLKLGIPTILASAMITMGFILINIEVNAFGHIVLNAQTIAVNINAVCFSIPASISATVTTMVSIYVGANQVDKAKRSFILAMIVSLLLSLIVFLAILNHTEFWVTLFRDDEEIVSIAKRALFLYTLAVPFFALFSNVQAVFIALGRTRQTLIFGILRIWLLRIAFIKVTIAYLGVDSVFIGNLFANSIAAIMFFILLIFTPWKSVIKNRDQLGAWDNVLKQQDIATQRPSG